VACVPVQSAQTTQASSDESCVSAQAQDAPYVAELPQGDVEAICQIIEGLQRVTRQRDDSCYERAQVGPGMRLGEYQPWFLEASPKMLHLWLRPRDPMSGADPLRSDYLLLEVDRAKPENSRLYGGGSADLREAAVRTDFKPCSRSVLFVLSAHMDWARLNPDRTQPEYLQIIGSEPFSGSRLPTARMADDLYCEMRVSLENGAYEYVTQSFPP
jgi:hypothetical protein